MPKERAPIITTAEASLSDVNKAFAAAYELWEENTSNPILIGLLNTLIATHSASSAHWEVRALTKMLQTEASLGTVLSVGRRYRELIIFKIPAGPAVEVAPPDKPMLSVTPEGLQISRSSDNLLVIIPLSAITRIPRLIEKKTTSN